MNEHSGGFVEIALRPEIVRPALKLSLVVGTVLALINHGDAILRLDMDSTRWLKIALTYLVPYSVSTYSAVRAIQVHERRRAALVQVGTVEVGDSIKLYGGYDYQPKWLGNQDHQIGKVIKFIPGQNTEPAAVVQLQSPITVDSVTGDILVLELRHQGAMWAGEGIVHIELCDFVPDDIRWQDRQQGAWVEAAASYAVL